MEGLKPIPVWGGGVITGQGVNLLQGTKLRAIWKYQLTYPASLWAEKETRVTRGNQPSTVQGNDANH